MQLYFLELRLNEDQEIQLYGKRRVMTLGLGLVDVAIIAPSAFIIGGIVGYVIRARYNGKEDKYDDRVV